MTTKKKKTKKTSTKRSTKKKTSNARKRPKHSGKARGYTRTDLVLYALKKRDWLGIREILQSAKADQSESKYYAATLTKLSASEVITFKESEGRYVYKLTAKGRGLL